MDEYPHFPRRDVLMPPVPTPLDIALQELPEVPQPSPIDTLLRGMKMPAFGGRYLCPVDDCAWQLDVPEPKYETFGTVDWTQNTVKFTMSGVDPQEVEQRLRQHFESHDVVEWAKTVQRLTFELAAANEDADESHG